MPGETDSFQRLVSDMAELRQETKELRAEFAKLWDAHLALQKRVSPIIIRNTRLG